ncbi:MAG: hypothetical protein R3B89_03955 [Polyangiaceae bacterium]
MSDPPPRSATARTTTPNGQVDEAGPAPDGINGTADPNDPSKVGDDCGVAKWDNAPQRRSPASEAPSSALEVSDPSRGLRLPRLAATTAKSTRTPSRASRRSATPARPCVEASAGNCQCAEPCGSGEFKCPTGSDCKSVDRSGTDQTAGDFCVSDPCGDCSTKTTFNTNGSLACGPEGTPKVGGRDVPVCACKGQAGCQGPCYGIACPDGQQCVPYGRFAGECRPDTNCNFFGCADGLACHSGAASMTPAGQALSAWRGLQAQQHLHRSQLHRLLRQRRPCPAAEVTQGRNLRAWLRSGTAQLDGSARENQDAGFACADSSCANPFSGERALRSVDGSMR